jgi:hypothetical protein
VSREATASNARHSDIFNHEGICGSRGNAAHWRGNHADGRDIGAMALAAGGYYWKRTGIRRSFCPHGQRLPALSKIAANSHLTTSNIAAQNPNICPKNNLLQDLFQRPV